MPFDTLTFVLFLLTVFALHGLLRDWQQRKYLLLAASYLFYAAWNPPFVLLLAFTTIVDWWLARRLDDANDPRQRKMLLGLSLLSNLGLLGYFKYGGFLLNNFVDLAGRFGVAYEPPAFDIVLPAGISFYTFQALSYTIDVYRRQIRATSSLSDFALFVSFFPQLVAGPIVRAASFLPQLLERRQITMAKFGWGLLLLIFGLFQKVVLADFLFAPMVDDLYAAPADTGWLDAWAGVAAFSGQIFCDFAGYSLCAIGIALCFGFELPDNFHHPFAAIGFSDFWRRWHISLSTWLRDYLYIPLGGNRLGARRTGINLMLTMLIGGLWHGASWLFVLWGGLHGLYLLIERRWFQGKLPQTGLPALAAGMLTFVVVTLTWIPFRSPDIPTMLGVMSALVDFDREATDDFIGMVLLLLCLYLLVRTQWVNRNRHLEDWFPALNRALQLALVSGSLISLFLVSGGQQRAFIYFQF
ncbi:MAG: MBOAT family protein [Betaproteobacteria bacterium]|nr:MBOAT family protein [Betaproteobacteria bacterium]